MRFYVPILDPDQPLNVLRYVLCIPPPLLDFGLTSLLHRALGGVYLCGVVKGLHGL